MRPDLVFGIIGQGIAEGLEAVRVPQVHIDHWSKTWELVVLDHLDDSLSPEGLAANIMETLTFARDLSRTYGRG